MTRKTSISKPVICTEEDLKGRALFKRTYFSNGLPVGHIIYTMGGSLYNDVLVDAIKGIDLANSADLQKRIEQEKAITFAQVFDEFYEQTRHYTADSLGWRDAVDFMRPWFFVDLSNGLLDREIPVEEALAKWVSEQISYYLRPQRQSD